MKTKIIGLCCFLCSFFTLAQQPMTPTEIDQLTTKVVEKAKETTTITCEFVQYKHLDFLANDIETFGHMAFKAPNTIKWAYTQPFEYSILFKDDQLYINDQGNKSAIDMGSNEMFQQLNTLIVNSIQGAMFDQEEFEIDYLKNEQLAEVHFSPKKEAFSKFIKAFHILFNQDGDVEQFTMVEPSGDYTKIIFKNKTYNAPLSDAVFTP